VSTPALRRLIAASQVLTLLSLSACASTKPPKAEAPPPTDYQVTVKPEPPGAAPPPAAEKSPQQGIPISPAPEAPKPPTILTPKTPPRGQLPPGKPGQPSSGPAERGQPVVRLRQAQTAPGQPAPQSPGRLVVFNFDNADIEIVLQATSELLVFNYVLAPGARGKKVTVQTTGRIPVDDIFPVLLTILDVNGLAAVKSGNLWRIIPKEGAVQTSTRTVVGGDLDPAVPGDEVVTQIVPLQFTSATDVLNLIRPFVPPQGAITATRDTNLLVVTDAAANIRRLLEMIKLVDVDVALNELQIIPLKHADAQDVAQILTQLFASGRFRPAGSQVPGAFPAPVGPVPGAPTAPRVPATAPTAPDQAAADRVPLIVPERRSNSLVIYARKQEMETIVRLVEKLDADIYGGQRVFFYFAENTKAKDLAATLDAIFGRGPGATSTTTTPTTTRPGAGGLPTQSTVSPTFTRTPTTTTTGLGRGPSFLEEGIAAETRFIPDETTNSIIVTTFPRAWSEIESIIKKLDRMPRQVLIEVLAAEVTLDDSTQLGIQWAIQHGRFTGSFNTAPGGSVFPTKPADLIPPFNTLLNAAPGFNFYTFAAKEFLLAINALAAQNKVNVLSSPSIMTAENKKAVINVSRSVPILTSQQVPIGATPSVGSNSIVGTQTVEYKDAGIILTVTPRIGEHGTVALDVKQEVNDVGDAVPPTNSPEFRKREAETSVVLLNNQTLVLGGLIQSRRGIVKSGIPLLYRIPVVGYLFGNTTEQIQKTELILLITPRVVGTALDAARVTEQLRNLTPELRDSIRDKQFPYPSFRPPQPNP
jgi:general secretion pathway protein D